jgi:hypothetical protein
MLGDLLTVAESSNAGGRSAVVALVAHVHGHLGWLAAAALVHPAIVLRRTERRAHLAVGSSVVLVTAAASLGAWLYPAYRESLRALVFLDARSLGLAFERKEHLAFGAVFLAWSGAAAYAASWRAEGRTAVTLRRTSHRAFVASAALAIVAAVLGTLVASRHPF